MATLSSIDSGLPFGDFRTLIERLPPLDERAAARVRDGFGRIEKPKNSLGPHRKGCRLVRRFDGSAAGCSAPGRGDLRRQSRDRAAWRLTAPG